MTPQENPFGLQPVEPDPQDNPYGLIPQDNPYGLKPVAADTSKSNPYGLVPMGGGGSGVEPPTPWGSLGVSLERGWVGMQARLAEAWAYTFPGAVGEFYSRQSELLHQELKKDEMMVSPELTSYDLSWDNIVTKPDLSAAWLANQVFEQLPQVAASMAAAFATRGASTAGQIASMAAPTLAGQVASVAPIAGQLAMSLPQSIGGQLADASGVAAGEPRKSLTNQEYIAALASGTISGGFEAWVDNMFIGRLGSLLESVPTDLTGKRIFSNQLGHGIMRVLTQANEQGGTEAATEGLQTMIENLGARWGWEPDRDLVQGVYESMVVGYASGAVSTAAGGAVSDTVSRIADERALNRGQGIITDQIFREELAQLNEALDAELNLDNDVIMPVGRTHDEYFQSVEYQTAKSQAESIPEGGEEVAMATALSMTTVESARLKTFIDNTGRGAWIKNIYGAIQSGMVGRAHEIAQDITQTGRSFYDTFEQAALIVSAFDLEGQISKTRLQIKGLDEAGTLDSEGRALRTLLERQIDLAQAKFNVVEDAISVAHSEAGSLLNASKMRKAFFGELYSEAAMIKRAVDLNGAPLDEEQTAKVIEFAGRIARAEEKYTLMLGVAEEGAADVLKKRAQEAIVRAAKRKYTREEIQESRKEIGDNIRRYLEEQASQVNANPPLSPMQLYQLGRYAMSLVHEGVVNVEEIVDQTLQFVNSDPVTAQRQIDDVDIYTAINSQDPSRVRKKKKKEQTAIQRVRSDIKKQANLLERIRKIEEGITIEDRPESRPDSAKVKELKKRLYELEKVLFKTERDEKKRKQYIERIQEYSSQLDVPVTEENKATLEAARTSYQQLRMIERTRVKAQEIRNAIADDKVSEYVEGERQNKNIPKSVLPELHEARLELSLAKRDVHHLYAQLQGTTVFQKIEAIAGIPRTLRAMADFSGTLRQGILPIMASFGPGGLVTPGANYRQAVRDNLFKDFTAAGVNDASGSVVQAQKAFFDPKAAEEIDLIMRATPEFGMMKEAGIFFADYGGTNTLSAEEMLGNKYAQMIPGAKSLIEKSNRHMATFLNMTRYTLMKEFIVTNPDASDASLKLAARFINNATGRGTIHAEFANSLSLAMFAPRFTASRLHMINPVAAIEYLKDENVRKLYTGIVMPSIINGLTLLGAATAAGVTVGWDPKDSDFLKMIFGNTRVDFFGGFAPLARLVAQIGIGTAQSAGALDDSAVNKVGDPYELTMQFLKYKASPLGVILYGAATNKDVFNKELVPIMIPGSETELWSRATPVIQNLYPIIFDDIYAGFKDLGPVGGAGVSLAALYGGSVNTYEDGLSKPQVKYVKQRTGYSPQRPRFDDDVSARDKRDATRLFEDLYATRVIARYDGLMKMNPDRAKAMLEDIASDARSQALRRKGLRPRSD